MRARTIWFVLMALLGLSTSGPASAEEVKVLSTTAIKEIFEELVPGFESATGARVTVAWSSTVNIRSQVGTGEVFDLVIVGAPEIDAFIKDGRIAAGSRVDLAASGVGVAVRAGAPRPDISSGEMVRKALLASKSVAYSTGPSGAFVQRLFDRMGIASQMAATAKQTAPGVRVGQYLARGDAELGFQQVSELIHEPGIDYLGPLPPDIQTVTVFSSGIPSGSKAPDQAKALQLFLTAPAAVPVIRKNGMDPAH